MPVTQQAIDHGITLRPEKITDIRLRVLKIIKMVFAG